MYLSARSVLREVRRQCGLTGNVFRVVRGLQTASDGDNYDVVIVGGGMVGTTMACTIANNKFLQNKKVLLLEGSSKKEYIMPEQYSNRVVALNQQTHTLLASIGAWKHIKAARYTPVKRMQVWDACSDAIITFNETHLSEELAYIVENDLLLHAVNKQLAEKPAVNVVYDAEVTDIKLPKSPSDMSKVKLKNGQEYSATLLIGADGSKSQVRDSMKVQYVNWNYDQMGLVATVILSEPTENIVAWQRFIPMGPVALLPLTDTMSSLVWSVNTEEAKRLMKLSEENFVDNLNDALWKVYPKDGIVESGMRALQELLGTLNLDNGVQRQLQPSVKSIVPDSRAVFPLGFGHSVNYVKQGVALIGDAAHRVHPLAGQGVNLGFGDIVVLVQCMAEAVSNGASLADITYLNKYETERQRHNLPTMMTIDALYRLYKGTAAPVVIARSLGLQVTNAFPIVKKAIMQHASGMQPNQRK